MCSREGEQVDSEGFSKRYRPSSTYVPATPRPPIGPQHCTRFCRGSGGGGCGGDDCRSGNSSLVRIFIQTTGQYVPSVSIFISISSSSLVSSSAEGPSWPLPPPPASMTPEQNQPPSSLAEHPGSSRKRRGSPWALRISRRAGLPWFLPMDKPLAQFKALFAASGAWPAVRVRGNRRRWPASCDLQVVAGLDWET